LQQLNTHHSGESTQLAMCSGTSSQGSQQRVAGWSEAGQGQSGNAGRPVAGSLTSETSPAPLAVAGWPVSPIIYKST